MSRGTDFPVTFTRLPLKLQGMQFNGINGKAIQDELAGQGFQMVTCSADDCTCGQSDHPEITAEVRNDFTETMQGIETGWWVCVTEDGKMFPVSPDVLEANYLME